jgi:hypothetical protein
MTFRQLDSVGRRNTRARRTGVDAGRSRAPSIVEHRFPLVVAPAVSAARGFAVILT